MVGHDQWRHHGDRGAHRRRQRHARAGGEQPGIGRGGEADPHGCSAADGHTHGNAHRNRDRAAADGHTHRNAYRDRDCTAADSHTHRNAHLDRDPALPPTATPTATATALAANGDTHRNAHRNRDGLAADSHIYRNAHRNRDGLAADSHTYRNAHRNRDRAPPPTATHTATALPPTATHTATVSALPPTATPTRTATAIPPAVDRLYLSATTAGTASGVTFAAEDVLLHDRATGVWAMHFDGSDVGLATRNLDVLELQADGSLLLSTEVGVTLPGLGAVDDSDIVRFIPTTTGTNTSGNYQWYFDGSDVGLTDNGEDVDALALLTDGRLLVSTFWRGDRDGCDRWGRGSAGLHAVTTGGNDRRDLGGLLRRLRCRTHEQQ